MIVVRLFDESETSILFESPVLDAKWERALNKTGEWTFQLPLQDAIYDILEQGLKAKLYYDGEYCIGGTIQDTNINYDLDPVIEVRGREEIDELYDFEGDSVFFPHAQNYRQQLFTLLDRGGWRFGEYKDIDPTKLITVDLRQERQLLTQIAGFLKQDPTLLYRYGGVDYAGQPMLDVSFFTDPYVHTVLNASPGEQSNAVVIESVKSKDTFTNCIYAARATGGTYRTLLPVDVEPRDLTLEAEAAIDADPTLAYDSDYPIYEEINSVTYVIIPTSVGPIGGRQYISHQAITDTPAIGATTAGLNSWAQFVMKPPPGLLTEFSFWPMTVINESTLKASNSLEWEICEVNEVTPHIPGAILSTGAISNDNWTANARCRVVFDDPVTVTYDKRLMFRVGFVSAPAGTNHIRLGALASNPARTTRYDRSNARSSGYNNLNVLVQCEAITTGTVTPRGRRAFLENTRIVPHQVNDDYSTTAEIQEASLSLYRWLVEQIEASLDPIHELSITLAGFDLSWRPGDNVLLLPQIQFPDGVRQLSETRTIESIGFSFSGQKPAMDVKFTLNSVLEMPKDTDVALWDEAQRQFALRQGQYIENPKEWQVTELTVSISGRAPDTTLSDGTPAISILFTVPDPPTGFYETRLLGTPYLVHTVETVPLVVELISKPPNDLAIVVAIKDVGWRPTDTATAYAHIVWR